MKKSKWYLGGKLEQVCDVEIERRGLNSWLSCLEEAAKGKKFSSNWLRAVGGVVSSWNSLVEINGTSGFQLKRLVERLIELSELLEAEGGPRLSVWLAFDRCRNDMTLQMDVRAYAVLSDLSKGLFPTRMLMMLAREMLKDGLIVNEQSWQDIERLEGEQLVLARRLNEWNDDNEHREDVLRNVEEQHRYSAVSNQLYALLENVFGLSIPGIRVSRDDHFGYRPSFARLSKLEVPRQEPILCKMLIGEKWGVVFSLKVKERCTSTPFSELREPTQFVVESEGEVKCPECSQSLTSLRGKGLHMRGCDPEGVGVAECGLCGHKVGVMSIPMPTATRTVLVLEDSKGD